MPREKTMNPYSGSVITFNSRNNSKIDLGAKKKTDFSLIDYRQMISATSKATKIAAPIRFFKDGT